MTSEPSINALRPEHAATLARLREALDRAEYQEDRVAATLKIGTVPGTIRNADVPLLARRLTAGESGHLATLIRLFLLGDAVATAEAAAALAPVGLAALAGIGFLAPDDSHSEAVRSLVQLTPWAGFVFAHDAGDPADLPADYVTGVNPASRTLAGLTIRQPVSAALDLGTGCGVQALLAAQHADRVVATDLNPRALWFARTNAQLNRVENLEVREGSLFEPVAGDEFDLIASNPPYVISPDTAHVYRDSGQPGDTLSRLVVSQVTDNLRAGGFATILCNWVCRTGQNWWEPLGEWLLAGQCDAWLLHYETDSPLTYAAKWNEPLRAGDPAEYAAALDRWCAYYQRLDIEAIAAGAVILRRRSAGTAWVYRTEMPFGSSGSASEHIQRVFTAQDYLSSVTDERDLLGEVFALAGPHRLDQRLRYQSDEYAVEHAVLTLEEGVGIQGPVAPNALHLLFAFDGARTLAELIDDLAEDLEIDRGELANLGVQTTRELLERGFLVKKGLL